MLNISIEGTDYICNLKQTWEFPVGQKYPPKDWYVATFHGPNSNYTNGFHTGLDINLAKFEYGDVERRLGLSVYALTNGEITYITDNWFGSPMLVMKVTHNNAPLWVRYGHIIPVVMKGERVKTEQSLGSFANWSSNDPVRGDHLHFDMCLDPIMDDWCTNKRWIDPITVLKEHLNPERVEEMLR